MRVITYANGLVDVVVIVQVTKPIPQTFPSSENERRNDDMSFVDQARSEEFSQDAYAIPNTDILSSRRFTGDGQHLFW